MLESEGIDWYGARLHAMDCCMMENWKILSDFTFSNQYSQTSHKFLEPRGLELTFQLTLHQKSMNVDIFVTSHLIYAITCYEML